MTVRIPKDLLEWLKEVARKEERSLNYIATRLIRQARDQAEAQQ